MRAFVAVALAESDSLVEVEGMLSALVNDVAQAGRGEEDVTGLVVPLRESRIDGRLTSLTRREREVLDLVCEGLANCEIARQLFISEKTAKVHLGHVFKKLGVRSRVQAVIAASGAVELADPAE
jgi:DNA-binding NarL/FixJ family response regulator